MGLKNINKNREEQYDIDLIRKQLERDNIIYGNKYIFCIYDPESKKYYILV